METDEEVDDRNKMEERRLRNEENKIWQNNVPMLYDLVLTHTLEWPSLTVQWVPDRLEPVGEDYSTQTLILGTRTTDNKPNYLVLAEVRLPLITEPVSGSRLDGLAIVAMGSMVSKVKLIRKIYHDGDVNKARYLPQNLCVIATKTVTGEVHIFDSTRHPLDEDECKPDLRLRGHKEEGFGLSWNTLKLGHLLSGSQDSRICLWDIDAYTNSDHAVDAMQIFKGHCKSVEDVAWHSKDQNIFGSVGDDHQLLIWDTRCSPRDGPSQAIEAHQARVNCLAFNSFTDYILATGSTDGAVAVFDLRNLGRRLHTLTTEHPVGELFQIGWSPMRKNILASCGEDRKVKIWDISRIRGEHLTLEIDDPPAVKLFKQQEKESPKPELCFIHGGYTDFVSDFSWNTEEEWMIASVAADNALQIWQMREDDFKEEEVDVDPGIASTHQMNFPTEDPTTSD